jgi:integrase
MTTQSEKDKRSRRANGEGLIRQRADGRFEGRLMLPSGKVRSVYGKTQKAVQAKLQELRQEVHEGTVTSSDRQTFRQFLEHWLTDVVQPNTRPGTFATYSGVVNRHIIPTLGRYRLKEITPQRIQQVMNAKRAAGLGAGMVTNIRAVIRAALSQAARWGLVARNTAKLTDPPRKPERDVPHLTGEQAKTLIASLSGDRLEAVVILTLGTGLRRGEVLGLRWSDVDLDGGLLHLQGQYQRMGGTWTRVELKSKTARRTLALPPFVVTALRQQRTRQLTERLQAGAGWTDYDLVFPSTTGEPMVGTTLSVLFRRRIQRPEVKRAGVPHVPFHGLRHSAATFLLSQGLSLGEIQKILGHASIQLTANLYAHFAPEIAARAADRMEAMFATG